MSSTLPAFPVDDETLALVEMAMDTLATGRSSLGNLLDLLSGYDSTLSLPVLGEDGWEIPGMTEYPRPLYSEHDVIRSLVAEVRRLRAVA